MRRRPGVFELVVGLAAVLATTLVLRATSGPILADVPFSHAVLDRGGKLLRLTITTDEKYRLWMPLDRVAPAMVEATLLKEDRYFYAHPGVNPLSLLRAAWQTVTNDDLRIGGSTVTMQLVRLRDRFGTRSVFGKLWQIARALWLEVRHSKREILEAYLNLAPYGLNVEGVGAASRIYFDKPPERLDPAQALTLAVLPQSPTLRSPRAENGRVRYPPALAKKREELSAMWNGSALGRSVPVTETDLPQELRLPSQLPFRAPHFVERVLSSGPPPGEVPTSLDSSVQALVERQVVGWIERRRNVGIRNAAVLVLDTKGVEPVAWVGSGDYFSAAIEGQVDGVTAMRSPGSTLKPFLYALAIDQGLVHPRSIVKDAPSRFGAQNPENFDRDFAGPLPLVEALNRSRNVPALWLNGRVRSPSLYEFLKDAAVPDLKPETHYGLGLVLGNAEVTLAKLAELYAVLANGGEYRPMRLSGARREARVGKRLLSPEAADLVLEMLESNPRPAQGYLDRVSARRIPVAWKTGTSFAFRDAWSVGVVGRYVVAVWVGNFDGRGNPVFTGREAAAPLLFGVVDSLRAESRLPARKIAKRLNVDGVAVCPVSGKLPGAHCKRLVTTSFIPGKSPIERCDIHREVWIDQRTGRRTCRPEPGYTVSEVYEFWSSDVLRLFRLAGVARRTPPPVDASCPLDDRASRGAAPEITSPVKDLTYLVRVNRRKDGADRIPLAAVVDADASVIHWFAGEQYLGKVLPSESLLWNPQPGRFTLRAVDDHGRSAFREVVVRAEE